VISSMEIDVALFIVEYDMLYLLILVSGVDCEQNFIEKRNCCISTKYKYILLLIISFSLSCRITSPGTKAR
jgi:hypothetical protein